MNAPNEIATKRSPVPVSLGGYLGDLVAWRFGRFSASRIAVTDAFSNHGFAACLDWDLSDPQRALMLAKANGIKFGETFDARTMEKPDKDTKAAVGVYERIPRAAEMGDEWICGARVRIDSATGLAVVRPPKDTAEREGCIEVARQIAERCNELIGNVQNIELSTAMVQAGRTVHWAAFRKAGGVYWVPSTGATRLRGLFDELEKLGQVYFTVQPLFADDSGRTARNIGFAAEEALRAELEELEADLARADGGELQEKGIRTRIVHCQEVLIRCEAYREALSSKADSVAQAIASIMDKFGNLIGETTSELENAVASLNDRSGV